MKRKKIILYPNNVIIELKKDFILLKGPLKSFLVPISANNYQNYNFNFKEISLKTSNSGFNQLILNPSEFTSSYYVNMISSLFTRYIQLSSSGHSQILQLWGIGFKISKRDSFTLINLGYSHSIKLVDDIHVFHKPFDNIYIFNTSVSKQILVRSITSLRRLRKKDPYKGKGVRKIGEKITLKIGKRE